MEKKPVIWRLLASLVVYIFFFGVSFVIAQFFQFPKEVSYGLFFVFGGLAVIIRIDPDNLKKLRHVPLLRRHFSMMYKVNHHIGQAVEEGSFKSSLRFALGMIFLIFYFAWINFWLNTIRYLLSLFMEIDNPLYRWMEAFFCLFAAGLVAFILWIQKLIQKQNTLISSLDASNFVTRLKLLRKQFSFGITWITLILAYLFWIGGLTLFLVISQEFLAYALYFFIGSLVFLVIIGSIVIGIFILQKKLVKKSKK